eukprot:m.1093841 g.1093841  ORF g.1093841 m.1093841 type:complete len:114 (-) comp24299_c0_seq14:1133-1474(-)
MQGTVPRPRHSYSAQIQCPDVDMGNEKCVEIFKENVASGVYTGEGYIDTALSTFWKLASSGTVTAGDTSETKNPSIVAQAQPMCGNIKNVPTQTTAASTAQGTTVRMVTETPR